MAEDHGFTIVRSADLTPPNPHGLVSGRGCDPEAVSLDLHPGEAPDVLVVPPKLLEKLVVAAHLVVVVVVVVYASDLLDLVRSSPSAASLAWFPSVGRGKKSVLTKHKHSRAVRVLVLSSPCRCSVRPRLVHFYSRCDVMC